MLKVLVVAAVAASLTAVDGSPCGDKFLVLGRGVRSQRAKGAVHKASIVIYAAPQSTLPAALEAQGLEVDFRLAGHRVRTATNRRELAAALESEPPDIVLAGIDSLPTVEPELAGVVAPPSLLPVLDDPTPQELATAQRLYGCALRSGARKQHYLAVIDEALTLRQRITRARAHSAARPGGEKP